MTPNFSRHPEAAQTAKDLGDDDRSHTAPAAALRSFNPHLSR
jgi:hypothetical protein